MLIFRLVRVIREISAFMIKSGSLRSLFSN
jgi:hypothetical protein